MEMLKVLLGWAFIILMMAAPILIPLILIQFFFGGIVAFIKGVATGQVLSLLVAVGMLCAAVAGGVYYVRWTGIGQEITAQSVITFHKDVVSREMLVRPRAWHGQFAVGPYAAEVLEHLMLNGKIDALVGDRRFLPLKKEKPAPSPDYWDERFRLTLKDSNCAQSVLSKTTDQDECLKAEQLNDWPVEPHFGFATLSRSSPRSEYLYYRVGDEEVKIATCTVEVRRPFLPLPQQNLNLRNAQDALRTGNMRVGKMDPYSEKEIDEMRKCRVELLRQFAAKI